MPPVTPQDLEDAGQITAVLTGLAALVGALYAAARWPIRYTGVQLHRYFGGLAWRPELETLNTAAAAAARIEPKVDALNTRVEALHGDVRLILDKLIPEGAGVAAPPAAYRPAPRDGTRRS